MHKLEYEIAYRQILLLSSNSISLAASTLKEMAAISCCLLVNKVVYKHVSMTSLFLLRKPPTKFHVDNIASFLNYGC